MKKNYITSLFILSILCLVNSGCAVVAVGAVGAATATGAAVGTDPRGSGLVIDDKSIQSNLSTKYSNSDNFPDSNIYIDVFNKVVLLTGQVKTQEQKDRAEQVARGYPGVIKIYNYLSVRLPSSITARSRDSLITTQLKAQLLSATGIPSNNIKVETTETIVYMMGILTQAQAESATKIAAQVGGVTKVISLFDYSSGK
jgi:osmotically-inducible protein OsmY